MYQYDDSNPGSRIREDHLSSGIAIGVLGGAPRLSFLAALSVDAVFHVPVRLQYRGAYTRANCINGMCGRASRQVPRSHVRAVCEHSHWTGDSSAEDNMFNPCIFSSSSAWQLPQKKSNGLEAGMPDQCKISAQSQGPFALALIARHLQGQTCCNTLHLFTYHLGRLPART
jgi:hypothetical protein